MKKKSYKLNILYNAVYRCVVIVTPLITSPYLSRVLGAEKLGIYAYASAFATYFVIFSLLGVSDYGNRTIAQVKGDRNRLSDSFWQIYYLQFFLTLAASAIYLAGVLTSAKYRTVQLVFGLYVLSSLFEVNWFAFGMEEFRLTSIRSIVTRLGIVICIFLFVKGPEDVWKYALITQVGNIVSQLVVLPLVFRYTDFRKPDAKAILRHLKPNLLLFLPVVASSVYQQLSKLMLGAWSTEAEVGFFQNAENIVTLPTFITTAIVTVMLPYASNLIAKGDGDENRQLLYSTLKYTSVLNMAMTFGMFAIAADFIPWYLGAGFSRSAELVMILAPMIFFNGFSSILRYQHMIPSEMDRANLISMFGGAGVDILASLLLIPKFGAAGAAVATVVAYCATLLLQILYVRKQLNLKLVFRSFAPTVLFGAAMLAVVKLVAGLPLRPLLLILVELACGAAVYLVCTVLWLNRSGDPVVSNMMKAFRKKAGG